jgi:hypothetical protein
LNITQNRKDKKQLETEREKELEVLGFLKQIENDAIHRTISFA